MRLALPMELIFLCLLTCKEGNNMYKVYIKTDDLGRITAINSSAFLSEEEQKNWTLIDEGEGDKFHHAQGNYLPKMLFDDNGAFRFKWNGEKIEERTEEEMSEDETPAVKIPTTEERLAALEQAGLERDSALMELAEMISNLIGGVL